VTDDKKRYLELFVVVACATGAALWFSLSRLGFVPVPWPDGSAFFLPSIEWLSWPPKWVMHSQAAFVPSYDTASFNMMVGFPTLLGVASRLGLNALVGGALAVKLVAMIAFVAWVVMLWLLARKLFETMLVGSRERIISAVAVTVAGALDPLIRWGTLVVRTEMWISLAWVVVLVFLAQVAKRGWNFRPGDFWKLAVTLSLAAYFHFEAFFIVPGVAAALFPWSEAGVCSKSGLFRLWCARLWSVSWRVLALLSPWLIFVLWHFPLFLEQMTTQFGRLSGTNEWMRDAYGLFHSLFLSLGAAEPWPKSLNPAKAVFWLLVLALPACGVFLWAVKAGVRSSRWLPLFAGCLINLIAAFYLWLTKPEVWFITLCHTALWPLAAVAVACFGKIPSRITVVLAMIFAALSLVATADQWRRIQDGYSWSRYGRWVDCIDGVLKAADAKKIWQPHVPDVLVELSGRDKSYDLTRSLDFERQGRLARDFFHRVDAVVLSGHFRSDIDDREPGMGVLRDISGRDIERMGDGVEVPFGQWVLEARWNVRICQSGPFWAAIGIAGQGRMNYAF